MRILIVDVGGNHAKLWHSPSREKRKFRSQRELTAELLVRRAQESSIDWDYDVVALGLPCRIVGGRAVDEPHNLGKGWVGFDFAEAFGKPVRILNDAALQALGAYNGGRMLFLGLGTSLGSTLIIDGLLCSLELGQLLHAGGEELAHLLGRQARENLGRARWEQRVHQIVPRLRSAMLADDTVLGGGGAKHLTQLPAGVRRGGNEDVVIGGERVWSEYPDPTGQSPMPRRFA